MVEWICRTDLYEKVIIIISVLIWCLPLGLGYDMMAWHIPSPYRNLLRSVSVHIETRWRTYLSNKWDIISPNNLLLLARPQTYTWTNVVLATERSGTSLLIIISGNGLSLVWCRAVNWANTALHSITILWDDLRALGRYVLLLKALPHSLLAMHW